MLELKNEKKLRMQVKYIQAKAQWKNNGQYVKESKNILYTEKRLIHILIGVPVKGENRE